VYRARLKKNSVFSLASALRRIMCVMSWAAFSVNTKPFGVSFAHRSNVSACLSSAARAEATSAWSQWEKGKDIFFFSSRW
jgi:hypothetical protein